MEQVEKVILRYVNVDTLLAYQNNAKLHPDTQIDKIAKSIEKYGFDQPIVVGRDMVIIKGHGRLLAAKKLGLIDAPVIISELSEKDAAAARLADNRVAESGWDESVLSIELAALEQLDVNLLDTGFDAKEINQLMGNLQFAADSADGGAGADSALDNDENSHVKMIQLFYSEDLEAVFRDYVTKLSGVLKTENMSDTVMAALSFTFGRHYDGDIKEDAA